MFKEICDELIEVFKPMADIYPFSSNRMRSIMEITVPVYDLSRDTERYKRFYMPENSDRMYLIYEGLGDVMDMYMKHDTLVYNGEIKELVLLDYKAMYSLEFIETVELSLIVLSALIESIILSIRKKHFVISSDTFSKVLDGAHVFMFIYVALNTFANSDGLRNIMTKVLNNTGLTINDINPYIDVVNNVGIETLLDNSGVVVGLNYDKAAVQED